ncbi:MAG: hypothetical protein EPO21_12135 [Chloroflexota bacterium]|nr:MAG: hypothetical protein EPO21_12135 [Chloroflexota bacterium]
MSKGNTATATIATPLPRARFARFDTKAIIGGVFFGIVMVLVLQITDRADVALTGGSFLIFGGISWAGIMGVSTLLCRQPGGVIAGLIQGVLAIVTGASPLAPTFPIVNAAGSLAYSVVASRLSMNSWIHHVLAQAAGNIVGNLLVAVGLFYILHLPVEIIILSSGVTAVVSIIGGTLLTKLVSDAVAKSGVLD